ncbi:MAG: hypothetical protein N2690_01020 [Rhodocyclaceae bacterium]|nr:hypothetical protein [Rhodocyclaceae bacterium]
MDKPNRLSLTFAVQQSAPAPEGGLRFTGIAYSGGVVPAYGWMGNIAIDLASLQNPDGDEIPVLENHDGRVQSIAGLGVINRFVDQAGITSLRIDGTLTAATEAGQRIARLLTEGFPLQLSVGINANLRETAQPIQINGQTLAVDAVFENALIRECSFVAVGADPETTVARLSYIPPTGDPPMQRSTEDAALIAELEGKVAALEKQLAGLRNEKRIAELSALFDGIGRDLPEGDALAPYLGMDDAAFAVFAADLKTVAAARRPAEDSALFSATALHKAPPSADRQSALLAAVERIAKHA